MAFSLKKLAKGVGKLATGDVLGGALSIAGGLIGSKGAKNAGAASAEGMRQGADYLTNQLTQTRADFQPYQQAGTNALNALANPSASFQQSPGYQFAVDQGLDAIKTQQNSLGRLASGNTLAALTQFGVGTAQQDYNNWWNQQSGLAGMGLNATGNVNSIGANVGGNIANLLAGAGNAKAGGIQGSADAWGNTISDLGGFWGHASANPPPAGGNGGGIVNTDLMNRLTAPVANKMTFNRLAYRG